MACAKDIPPLRYVMLDILKWFYHVFVIHLSNPCKCSDDTKYNHRSVVLAKFMEINGLILRANINTLFLP